MHGTKWPRPPPRPTNSHAKSMIVRQWIPTELCAVAIVCERKLLSLKSERDGELQRQFSFGSDATLALRSRCAALRCAMKGSVL